MKTVLAIAALITMLPVAGMASQPENAATTQALSLINYQINGPICHHNDAPAKERLKLAREISKITTQGFVDAAKMTPIDYAVLADDPESIKRLISIGYDPKSQYYNPLSGAAQFNAPNAMKALLVSGVSPNAKDSGDTVPLMAAASQNRQEMIKMLFQAGANPNPLWNKISPLDYAMPCGDQSLIDLLLENGVKPSERTEKLAKKFGLSIKPKR